MIIDPRRPPHPTRRCDNYHNFLIFFNPSILVVNDRYFGGPYKWILPDLRLTPPNLVPTKPCWSQFGRFVLNFLDRKIKFVVFLFSCCICCRFYSWLVKQTLDWGWVLTSQLKNSILTYRLNLISYLSWWRIIPAIFLLLNWSVRHNSHYESSILV